MRLIGVDLGNGDEGQPVGLGRCGIGQRHRQGSVRSHGLSMTIRGVASTPNGVTKPTRMGAVNAASFDAHADAASVSSRTPGTTRRKPGSARALPDQTTST